MLLDKIFSYSYTKTTYQKIIKLQKKQPRIELRINKPKINTSPKIFDLSYMIKKGKKT